MEHTTKMSIYWTTIQKFLDNIFGKGYMFRSPRNLLAVHELDGITFKLKPNASYSLAVHDPKYFILTGRPLVFPGIFRHYLPDVSTLSTT